MGAFKDSMDSNKDEEYILRGPDMGFTPDPKGIGFAYYTHMSKNRNLVAQINGLTGVKDTYGHLLQRCINTALEMRSRGIQRKDIITICSFNHLNSCVPLIASFFLGATPACFDPLLSLTDIVHLLKQVQPKMAFVGPEAVELIENAFSEANVDAEIVVFGHSEKYSDFSEFFASRHTDIFTPVEIADSKETAMIFFSSGTTGLPKGICLSHYAIMGQAYTLVYMGFALDVCLIFSSFYWISSTKLLTACILGGGCRLIYPRYNPKAFWKLLDKFKVTMTFLAPSQAIAMYKEGRPEGTDTTQLADAIIGGGPISPQHVEEIREIFPGTNVNIIYGQTEVAGIVTNFNRNLRQHVLWMHQKPGSAGTVSPDSNYKFVDPETDEILGPNEQGELRIKTKYQMNGYYYLDSTGSWDTKGWLKTGDIGYYDEDGCIYIVDRIKDMLKFQSFHIPPAVIEGVLMTNPKIAAAVVVGVPHDEDGDHPLAAITLKDPSSGIAEEEVEKYVEDRLDDKYRLRGGVRILEKMPLTATGKIRRTDLRKMVTGKL